MSRKISAIAVLAILSSGGRAISQIVPDETLGNERSRINSFSSQTDVIEGGAARGINLFHSFRDFNVEAGRGVYFISPTADVQNILARVTGSNPSQILGLLGTASRNGDRLGVSNANLFLINPKGIVFGKDALLDVDRSFFATTANGIQFGNNSFSATNPQAVLAVLSVAPSAFLFSQVPVGDMVPVGDIAVRSNTSTSSGNSFSDLRVPNGQSLILLGGNVNVEGGQLSAFGGRVEIGAVAGAGVVRLNPNESLEISETLARADIDIKNSSVTVAANNAGNIEITGGNIRIDQSNLYAGVFGNSNSQNNQAKAGDLTLDATGSLQIGNSVVADAVFQNQSGNGGDLLIKAGALFITDNSEVISSTFGTGDAGRLLIKVIDQAVLDNSNVSSVINSTGLGNTGDVTISARSLELKNGARLIARGSGRGDTGNVSIDVIDRLILSGENSNGLSSAIDSSVNTTGVGNGGNISIRTNTLELKDNARISVSSLGQGNSGNVLINVADHAKLDSGYITSNIAPSSVGNSGEIRILTRVLELGNGAQLVSEAAGFGDGGNITVFAADKIAINGSSFDGRFVSRIVSNVSPEGLGTGGGIRIASDTLQLSNGGQLIATTQGNGNGGGIEIATRDTIRISGANADLTNFSGILTSTATEGEGGNISVNASTLQIIDGAEFNAITTGKGNGGNILINIFSNLELINGGSLRTTTVSNGQTGRILINAGDRILIAGRDRLDRPSNLTILFTSSSSAGEIELKTRDLTLDDGGEILVSAPSGNGGNLKLNIENSLLMFRESKISAEAGNESQIGNGGNIDIAARFIIAIPKENSDISANAFQGRGGRVTISTQGGILGLKSRPRSTSLSDITASSEVGISGTVTLNAPDTNNLQNSLAQLPQSAIDTNTLLANSCIARNRQNGSFYITGTGGLPTNPGETSTYSTGTVRPVTAWKPGDAIVEPQGVYSLPNGQLIMSRECD